VPPRFRHHVAFQGLLGALILRAVFILVGALAKFHFLSYLLGAFLMYTRCAWASAATARKWAENSPVVRFLVPPAHCTQQMGGKFFVRRDGCCHALFVVLVMVEHRCRFRCRFHSRLFWPLRAIHRLHFNVFALLGLRAMYFALAGMVRYVHYLHYGLSLILVFIRTKILMESFFPIPGGVGRGGRLAAAKRTGFGSLAQENRRFLNEPGRCSPANPPSQSANKSLSHSLHCYAGLARVSDAYDLLALPIVPCRARAQRRR
jgi:tellurite resistance protein TerC